MIDFFSKRRTSKSKLWKKMEIASGFFGKGAKLP